MLSQYDPAEDKLIGSLSEATEQLFDAGYFAFGGMSLLFTFSPSPTLTNVCVSS